MFILRFGKEAHTSNTRAVLNFVCSTDELKDYSNKPVNSFMTEADICSANQWTGFYMISATDVKELNRNLFSSSHQRCSLKKGVLKDFSKFTGKHLWQGLFFNKVEIDPGTAVFL